MTEICTIETGDHHGPRKIHRAHWRVGGRAGSGCRGHYCAGAALAETDETPSTSASTDRTALIMGGTTIPTPDDHMVELIKNQYIAPTLSGPGHRLRRGDDAPGGLATHGIPPPGRVRARARRACGARVAQGWPDEPWWKLSGLFDLTLDQSLRAGLADLEHAMAEHGNDHLVIYGASQGSIIETLEKRKLARAVPGGNQGPRHRLRDASHAESAQRGLACPLPGPVPTDPRLDVQRPRADRHPVRHGDDQPAVRLLRRLSVVPAQFHRRFERVAGRLLRAPDTLPTSVLQAIQRVAGLSGQVRRHRATTSSRTQTCRCSVRCAPWVCRSR